MKITKLRNKELNDARKLQKKAVGLHLPCPPVAWFEATILDEAGEVEEIIQCKSNSYTRNGLNLIAYYGIYPQGVYSSTIFGNGVVSFKNTGGGFPTAVNGVGLVSSCPMTLKLGLGTGAETIDSYLDPTSPVTTTSTNKATTYDTPTNTLRTVISVTYSNVSGSTVTLTESTLQINSMSPVGATSGTLSNVLVVRDLFDTPIAVETGKSLVFNYNFEIVFPQ